jgi:hypothetical protein
MNNKGFGIETIFIFIGLVFVVFLSIYNFINTAIVPLLRPKKKYPNYTNEYRLYIRDHNLNK